jgi:predicted dehydrogenase
MRRKMDKVKVGIVGCGNIAEAHLKALSTNPSVELVAFCDVDLSRAETKAKTYGVSGAKIFNSAKEMINTTELDAVYFLLPPFAHGDEVFAIRKGIPFFVEKPIELKLENARKILREIKKKKTINAVGYMNRYRESVKLAKKEFENDVPILSFGGWIGGTPKSESWWIVKNKSGGQFHEQVTHTVDLVRFLCGEVKEVQAYKVKGMNKGVPASYDVEDASVVNMKLEKGGVANLFASCSSNGGGGGVFLNVYAYETTALFSGWEHSLRLLKNGKEVSNIKGEPNIFEIEDAIFIEAVKNNDSSKIMSTYEDAIKTLAVTLAANNSMKSGKVTKVPKV